MIRGKGTFERNGEAVPFKAGDLLAVAAGEEHRFVEYSEDFETWVIFHGPERS